MMMPLSSEMFYQFINDLGDVRGMTLIALYADLRIYMNFISEKASEEELQKQAQIVFQDYIIEGNTYEMEANEIVLSLRDGYDTRT